MTLESKSIDITSYSGVTIDIDAYTNNTLEVSGAGQDKVEVYYSIDDDSYVKISTGTALIGSFSYKHINQGGLSGSTLRVKIEISNNDVSEYTEIDNITVTGFSPAVNAQHTKVLVLNSYGIQTMLHHKEQISPIMQLSIQEAPSLEWQRELTPLGVDT